MGVPSFFKWLAKRYPKSVGDAVESTSDEQAGTRPQAIAATGPVPPPIGQNPLVDNLYLDMNGIIHPCCHPEEGGSFTEEQMLVRIWAYVQRLVTLTRPQRLVYMAIDGVAPRAKLNQQRSRRFRSAKEAQQKQEVRTKLAAEWKARGLTLPPAFERAHDTEEWDTNVITPGTPFMAKVSAALHYHVEHALQFDPAWRHLTVIFSDATVPGEGEHKIIHWIRQQRADPAYDANTRHCLYGMDADLIMLGLATHERYFFIVRESLGDTSSNAHVKCAICGERGHYSDRCEGTKWTKKAEEVSSSSLSPPPSASPEASPSPVSSASPDPLIPQSIAAVVAFQFVHLPVLREYLQRELSLPPAVLGALAFPYSFEAMLDDFLLLCMFVGNDFLPHLPSLEIKEGAIEMLLKIYKTELPKLGGYLTHQGEVHLQRLMALLVQLGAKENDIFSKRRGKEEFHKRKDAEHKQRITRIRNDNATRERALNKHGKFAYDEPAVATKKETQAPPPIVIVAPSPVAVTTSGFIHPSRQVSDPTSSSSSSSLLGPAQASSGGFARNQNTGSVAPPSTPAPVVAVPVVAAVQAPKANLSAAALLRQKLKAGGSMATTAAPVSAAVVPDANTPTAESSMDTSGMPSSETHLLRQASDPIPCATAAMSGLTTAHADEAMTATAPSTLPGKRKEHPTDVAPDAMEVTVIAPASSSPPLELPLKKTKTGEEIATEATSLEPQVFDPLEEDQFGNLISGQSFDTYFAAKWEDMNAPADVVDPVRFGVDGWKQRYYEAKLKFSYDEARADPISSDARALHQLCQAYLEGLCWVMHYYFCGPASWSWYFPFHYAPLAEDLATFLAEGGLKGGAVFDLAAPFTPVGQLMAVLPSRSRHCVPKAVRSLMTADAEQSPLADFYPNDFELDLNGKRFMWQAVALLPFIDAPRLLGELEKVSHTFTEEERVRNSKGHEYVFANAKSPLGQQMAQVYVPFNQVGEGGLPSLTSVRWLKATDVTTAKAQVIDVAPARLSGSLRPYSSASVPSLPSVHFAPLQPEPTQEVEVVSAVYSLPPVAPHRCEMLPGAAHYVPELVEDDFRTMAERREYAPRNNRGNWNNRDRNAAGDGLGGAPRFQVRPIGGGPSPGPPAGAQQPGYYLAGANAPAHLAGHALNPNFYPPQQHHQMVYGHAGGPPMPMPMGPPMPMPMPPPHAMPMPPYPMLPQQGYYPPPPQGFYPPPPQSYPPPPGHPSMMMPPPNGYYPPPPQMMGAGYGPPVPGFGRGYPLAPPPSAGVQAFLSAPPPPGKPAGWLPPPVQHMLPGFSMPAPPAPAAAAVPTSAPAPPQ